MAPDPTPHAGATAHDDSFLRKALGGMSLFTLAMTVPQVWTICRCLPRRPKPNLRPIRCSPHSIASSPIASRHARRWSNSIG